jgi:hypothetical protein
VWPEPEAVVLEAEALVRDAGAAVSRLRRVVRDLADANTELKVSDAEPGDAIASVARRYRRAAGDLELAIDELERALPPLEVRDRRIQALLASDRLTPHVADDYAAALARLASGASSVRADLAGYPKALGRVGESLPHLRPTIDRLTAGIERVSVALSPASPEETAA